MIKLSHLTGQAVEFAVDTIALHVFSERSEGICLLDTPREEPSIQAISWPGEYDFSGVAVTGVGHAESGKVSYILVYDNVKTGFLADPLHDVNDHDLELLGNLDVLVMPVADGKLVQKLVDEIDPRVLVLTPGSQPEKTAEALKAVGASEAEAQAEYKLKSSLPAEGREVVLLG